MKTLIKRTMLLLFSAGFISGCGVYEPIEVVPDYIRTLYIKPVKNETQQIGLSSALTQEVINEFVKEGRLTVVGSENSDSSLEATIVEYSKLPIAYNEHLIAQEYKLTMIVNLKFYDHVKKLKLWEDIRMELSGGIESNLKYYVGQEVEFAETEEEARQRLIEDIAGKILHRTVYGWE